jgi:hypothetical protein
MFYSSTEESFSIIIDVVMKPGKYRTSFICARVERATKNASKVLGANIWIGLPRILRCYFVWAAEIPAYKA